MDLGGVVGLDLSLTSTGVATASRTWRIRPKAVKKDAGLVAHLARIRHLRVELRELLRAAQPELVVVEGPSYGSVGGMEHERGGLWWGVAEEADLLDIPIMVATPTMIKKYATGAGNADKDLVLTSAVRRFEWFGGGNDEADALWACAMGYQWLGSPLVDLPAKHLEALKTWPADAQILRVASR